MTMKDILARLVSFRGKTRNVEDPVSKESIEKLIEVGIKNHRSFYEPLLRLSPKEFNDTFADYTNVSAKDKYSATKYRTQLRGKAASLEQKHFLQSLIHANKRFEKELKHIREHLDVVLTSESFALEDCTISNMSLMGVLRQSDILSHWSIYLWDRITSAISPKSTLSPNYRVRYLERHEADIIIMLNDICEEKLPVNFIKETEKLKKGLADVNMFTSDNKVNMIVSSMNTGNMRGFFGSLGVLISMLNVFRWPLEMWDEYLYRKNLEAIEIRNWMEQRVAAHRLHLMKISPDDPKYYKLQKVIEAYDNKITEYAEKIAKYEEEGD